MKGIRVSPRSGINLTIVVLGLLTLMTALVSSHMYYSIAKDYHEEALVKIAKLKSKDLLASLKQNTSQLTASIISEKKSQILYKAK